MQYQQYPEQVIRPTLYKEQVSTGSHTYFIELKQATNGSKYLVIDQGRKRSGKYENTKMRIFEDEMLEFQRILGKMIHIAHNYDMPNGELIDTNSLHIPASSPNHHSDVEVLDLQNPLYPAFYSQLLTTQNWSEFEEYTYYLIKLIGVQTAYKFLGERQAGKADGFFKFGNFAVLYDCTLDSNNLQIKKQDQILNYCHQLQSGRIELSGNATEEFYHHHKQVWIITRHQTQTLQMLNDIVVKEVNIQELMTLYQQRLQYPASSEQIESTLRNL